MYHFKAPFPKPDNRESSLYDFENNCLSIRNTVTNTKMMKLLEKD